MERWSFASPVPRSRGPVHRRHDLRRPRSTSWPTSCRPSTGTTSATRSCTSTASRCSCSTASSDLLTPPAHSEEIVRLIPGAEHVVDRGRRAHHHARAPRGAQRAVRGPDRARHAGRRPRASTVARKPRVRRTVTTWPSAAGVAKARRGRTPCLTCVSRGPTLPTAEDTRAWGVRLGRAAARRRPRRAHRRPRRRQDHADPGHRRGPRRARPDHLADLRHRPRPPVARRRARPRPRRRLPAGRVRRARRPRPRRRRSRTR